MPLGVCTIQILEGMDSFVTGYDGMTESACENVDNPLLGEPVVSVRVVFLIDGLTVIDSSTGFVCMLRTFYFYSFSLSHCVVI
jgi:hypothetical protein